MTSYLNFITWNKIRIMSNVFQHSAWWRHQKRKHFPRYSPFETVIHCSPVTHTMANDVERCCFLWSAPGQKVEQTIEPPVILDAIELIMALL